MTMSIYLPSSLAIPPIFEMVLTLMREPEDDLARRTDAYFLLTALLERRVVNFSTLTDTAEQPLSHYQLPVYLLNYHVRRAYHPAAIRVVRSEAGMYVTPRHIYVECYEPLHDRWETFPFANISHIEVLESFASLMTEERERQFAHPVEARAYQAMAGEG